MTKKNKKLKKKQKGARIDDLEEISSGGMDQINLDRICASVDKSGYTISEWQRYNLWYMYDRFYPFRLSKTNIIVWHNQDDEAITKAFKTNDHPHSDRSFENLFNAANKADHNMKSLVDYLLDSIEHVALNVKVLWENNTEEKREQMRKDVQAAHNLDVDITLGYVMAQIELKMISKQPIGIRKVATPTNSIKSSLMELSLKTILKCEKMMAEANKREEMRKDIVAPRYLDMWTKSKQAKTQIDLIKQPLLIRKCETATPTNSPMSLTKLATAALGLDEGKEEDDDDELPQPRSDTASEEDLQFATPRDRTFPIDEFDRDFMAERNTISLELYKLVAGPPLSGIVHFIIYNLYKTQYEGAILYGRFEFDLETYPKYSPRVWMFTENKRFDVGKPFSLSTEGNQKFSIHYCMRSFIPLLIEYAKEHNSDEDIAAFHDVVINSMIRNVENADFCRYFPDATFSYRKTLLNVLDSSNSDASNVSGDADNVIGDAANISGAAANVSGDSFNVSGDSSSGDSSNDSGDAANVGADQNKMNPLPPMANQIVFCVVYSIAILCVAVFIMFLGTSTASFGDYMFTRKD